MNPKVLLKRHIIASYPEPHKFSEYYHCLLNIHLNITYFSSMYRFSKWSVNLSTYDYVFCRAVGLLLWWILVIRYNIKLILKQEFECDRAWGASFTLPTGTLPLRYVCSAVYIYILLRFACLMAAAAYLLWHVMTSRYRELQAGREYERPILSFWRGTT